MSFDLSFDGVLEFASSLFNSLWPVFKVPLGLVLAFGLLTLIYNMVVNQLRNIGK